MNFEAINIYDTDLIINEIKSINDDLNPLMINKELFELSEKCNKKAFNTFITPYLEPVAKYMNRIVKSRLMIWKIKNIQYWDALNNNLNDYIELNISMKLINILIKTPKKDILGYLYDDIKNTKRLIKAVKQANKMLYGYFKKGPNPYN